MQEGVFVLIDGVKLVFVVVLEQVGDAELDLATIRRDDSQALVLIEELEQVVRVICEGKLDTEPLITHTYPLSKIDEAYELFEEKRDGVIKVAVEH